MSAVVTIALVLYFLLLCGFVCQIILNYANTNPIKAVGWILAIVFIPVIGLILYIVVGRNLRRRRFRYQHLRDAMKKNGTIQYGFNVDCEYTISNHYEVLNRLLDKLSFMPMFPGNSVEFFSTGKDKFENLFRDINNAKDHINILYFTIGDDQIGNKFRELLAKKVSEGVEIRLLYDDMGCNETSPEYFKKMAESGVIVDVFAPLKFPRLLRSINYRNHKKIVVIDGEIAYTGGFNIKDEYVKGVEWGVWRDLHLRIQGSAAQGLQMTFITDWFYTSGEYLSDARFFPPIGVYGNNPMQVVSAEPLGLNANIMQGMLSAINRARRTIYIESPYVVPSDELLTALQNAALSGLDVKIIMPQRSDNPKVQRAANTYVSQLLSAGVEIYQYTSGFIHSKLMLIDDDLTIAGSSNLDMRSLDLNFETNVFIYDQSTVHKAMKIFEEDLKVSVRIRENIWNNRPLRTRFVESFFRLFSPLL